MAQFDEDEQAIIVESIKQRIVELDDRIAQLGET